MGEATYNAKARTITLKTNMVTTDPTRMCDATFKLYPVDRRWKRSSSRRIGISDISGVSYNVTQVMIDSTPFTRNNSNQFVATTAPEDPIREETINPSFTVRTRQTRLECEFEQS